MRVIDTDGARIAYDRSGRGPAVVLIQGAGVVGEGWRPQVAALESRFDMVRLDNRGIGASTTTGALTIEAMAADVIAVMDAERLDRVHLAGHSMGGLIGQEVALMAPSRVRSLALLCTFAHGAQAATISLAMIATALRTRIGTRAMRRRAFLELVMPQDYLRTVDCGALAEDLRSIFGHDLSAQPSIALRQVRAMARFDRFARLPALASIPTLVVSAEHDRIARRAYGRELAGAIPGAKYLEIPAAGHAVTIQEAGKVNAALAAHWSAAVA